MNRRPLRIWGWPLALAALTLFGLLAALLGGEGVWRGLAWIALAAPLAAILRSILRTPIDSRGKTR